MIIGISLTNPPHRLMTSYIFLQNLRVYAYHGVSPQEQLVGNEYTIDLRLQVDFQQAAITDDVTDTVNYAEVVSSIRDEMSRPSQLLEHIAVRVARRLFADFPSVRFLQMRIAKRNPPMGADIDAAGVEIELDRSEV